MKCSPNVDRLKYFKTVMNQNKYYFMKLIILRISAEVKLNALVIISHKNLPDCERPKIPNFIKFYRNFFICAQKTPEKNLFHNILLVFMYATLPRCIKFYRAALVSCNTVRYKDRNNNFIHIFFIYSLLTAYLQVT